MKKTLFFLLSFAALSIVPTHAAVLNVLACEPEWESLVREIADNHAKVTSATTALQNPHHIEARPALIAQARRADLLICTGADLEIGWLPLLQRESGNANIQAGQLGYLEIAQFISLIEIPLVIDRSMGDVHAAGNPHFHLDPRNLLKAADALTKRLIAIDNTNTDYYTMRHQAFSTRMQTAIVRWQKEAATLKGIPVVVHHKSWSYLANWLELKVVADLEPKPGIDPSVAYLGQLLDKLKTQHAKMVLRAPYDSPKASEWIAQRTGLHKVSLPYTVGGSDKAKDLFTLFEDTLIRLKEASQ